MQDTSFPTDYRLNDTAYFTYLLTYSITYLRLLVIVSPSAVEMSTALSVKLIMQDQKMEDRKTQDRKMGYCENAGEVCKMKDHLRIFSHRSVLIGVANSPMLRETVVRVLHSTYL